MYPKPWGLVQECLTEGLTDLPKPSWLVNRSRMHVAGISNKAVTVVRLKSEQAVFRHYGRNQARD